MAKRGKSKAAKTSFGVKNKLSIEPVEEIREIMEEVEKGTVTYPKLKFRVAEQMTETAAARETVETLKVEAPAETGVSAETGKIQLIFGSREDAETHTADSEPCGLDDEELLDLDPGDYGEEKYLTIKQLATILQVELSTIRHWEREFAEYLGQAVIKNQRKLFTPRQLEVFTKIKELLKTEQYTIEGAKRRLELDNILSNSLGVEHNFKTTVFIMLSAIMQELQASRQESRELARQVARLQVEKHKVEEQLQEEQNKGLLDFLKTKLNKKNPVGKEA